MYRIIGSCDMSFSTLLPFNSRFECLDPFGRTMLSQYSMISWYYWVHRVACQNHPPALAMIWNGITIPLLEKMQHFPNQHSFEAPYFDALLVTSVTDIGTYGPANIMLPTWKHGYCRCHERHPTFTIYCYLASWHVE